MKRIIIAISLISLSSSSVMPAMSALGCMGSSIASGFNSVGRNVAGNLSTFWPWYAIGTAAAAGLGYVGYLGAKKEQVIRATYNGTKRRRFETLLEIVENKNEVPDILEYENDEKLLGQILDYNDALKKLEEAHHGVKRQAQQEAIKKELLEKRDQFKEKRTELLTTIHSILDPMAHDRKKLEKSIDQKLIGYIGATFLGALMVARLLTNRSYQWHECSYHPNQNPDRFESGDEFRARVEEAVKSDQQARIGLAAK